MESKIVRAYNDIPLKMHDWNSEKSKQALVAVITEWAFMVGTKEANSREETLINVKFIITNYGDFTLEEIKNAMNWSLTNELEVDSACYGRFAPMYIAKILNAYADKRHNTIRTLFFREREDRQKKEEAKKLQAMPYADRVIEKRKFLIDHMTLMLKSGVADAGGNLVWRVMERNGNLKDSMVDEIAIEYGKKKLAEEKFKERMNGGSKTISKAIQDSRDESSAKRHQRDNLIHRFLSSLESIEIFVNGMSDKIIMGNER